MGKREIERCNGKRYCKVLLSESGRNKERSLRNNKFKPHPKRIPPQGRKQEYPHLASVLRYREKRLALIQESKFNLLTTYNNKQNPRTNGNQKSKRNGESDRKYQH